MNEVELIFKLVEQNSILIKENSNHISHILDCLARIDTKVEILVYITGVIFVALAGLAVKSIWKKLSN